MTTPNITDAARDAVRKARQFYDVVVLNASAAVVEELLSHNLIGRDWRMDHGGRPAWPLTAAGLQLRDELRPRNPFVRAWSKQAAARWLTDVQRGPR
jgi:hypothetical protein